MTLTELFSYGHWLTVEPTPPVDIVDIGYSMLADDLPRTALFMACTEPLTMVVEIP